MTSSALEKRTPARPSALAPRYGSAIALRLRLPYRRSPAWLAGATTAAVSSGAVGVSLTIANGSALGAWLIVGAGLSATVALLQAADLHRRPL
jgi:hypothetical protein